MLISYQFKVFHHNKMFGNADDDVTYFDIDGFFFKLPYVYFY